MNKRLYVYAAVLLVLAVLAFSPPRSLVHALGATDVVARFASSSFPTMVATLPRPPEGGKGGWTIQAPDGSANFTWWVGNGAHWAAGISFPAEPFLRAGLDPERLPAGMLQGGWILIALAGEGGEPGSPVTDGVSAMDDFAALVRLNRGNLGYHSQLDHFGFELGGGNMFEWARAMEVNDKDMVFVLEPAVFLEAGVDRDAVEGWIYGTVIVDDEYGRQVPVEKFLKPFDLDGRG